MINWNHPLFVEERTLYEKWLNDPEGLTADEYIDKHCSNQYRVYLKEFEEELAEAEREGLLV